MKARDVFAAASGRSARQTDGASAPRPRAKLLLALAALVALSLVLGVALATATAPAVTVEDATNVGYTTAEAEGTVNPEDKETSYHFEYATQADFSDAVSFGAGGPLAAGSGATPVQATATGLAPGQTYHLRLVASNADGETAVEAAQTFTTPTPPTKPTIARETLWEPTQTSIQLNARVDPHNSTLTDCHFEYGTGGTLDHEAPCESPFADGSQPSPGDPASGIAAARVSGLDPDTEYSFRLVASNAAGTEAGAIRSFTTLAPPVPQSCANQAIREAQHATSLPNCRAYEMASPLEKNGGEVAGDGPAGDSYTTVAARDGGAAEFAARVPFGDAIGSGASGFGQYVARRGVDGWGSRGITPTPAPDAKQTFLSSTHLNWFSEDLRSAIMYAYDLPAASDDVPFRENLYVEDTETRELQTITASQHGPLSADEYPPTELLSGTELWGYSADARHLAFVTAAHLIDAAPEGVPSVYRWDEGLLSLAGVLPDGNPPPEGSTVIPANYRGAMSADGSRQLFTAAPEPGAPPQLYMRVGDERTIWISEPEEGADTTDPESVDLQAMTPDGRNVFFVTSSRLLAADTNDGPDLYRWTDSPDPSSEANLTLISHGGEVPGNFTGSSVVGTSDDGERVFFQTTNVELRVWDHGTERVVAPRVLFGGSEHTSLAVTGWGPGLGRVSSNGNWLAFAADFAPDNVHGRTGRQTNNEYEFYLYNFEQDTLRCVSCPDGPASADAKVSSPVTGGNPAQVYPAIRPRFLAEDGRVFFTTPEALLPADTNGLTDAYQYDPRSGDVSLLSTGRGSRPATFGDASASGDDAFILTGQQLTAADDDGLVDLYDVRTGGGFPEPTPPVPCGGEACQGEASSVPSPPTLASHARSAGNTKKGRRCRKHRRGRRHHGACTHKKHRHSKRAANANRRASK